MYLVILPNLIRLVYINYIIILIIYNTLTE